MPGQQRGAGQPDHGPPGADGLVELLGDLDRPRAWMLLAAASRSPMLILMTRGTWSSSTCGGSGT